jgi:hypothetical protein
MMSNETLPNADAGRLDRGVRRLRVHVTHSEPDRLEVRYHRRTISVFRGRMDRRWYIRVWEPNGCYSYDGWWQGSDGRTAEEAIAEACRGAMLPTPND